MKILTDGVDWIAVLDDQLFREETQVFDGLDPAVTATGPFEQLILEIVVEDVVVGDANQLAHELAPSDVRSARMQARMGLLADEAELNQSENVIRVAAVADRSTENGARFRNSVVFDVVERVAIGESFEREAGQEIQILSLLQQNASTRNFHNLQ